VLTRSHFRIFLDGAIEWVGAKKVGPNGFATLVTPWAFESRLDPGGSFTHTLLSPPIRTRKVTRGEFLASL